MFLLVTVIAHQFFGGVVVYYEMQSAGAATRAELANDFGLGLLWLFIVVPGSLVVGAISFWLVWRRTQNKE